MCLSALVPSSGTSHQLLLDSIMILPVWQYYHPHFKNMHKFSDDMVPNNGPTHGFDRVDSNAEFLLLSTLSQKAFDSQKIQPHLFPSKMVPI